MYSKFGKKMRSQTPQSRPKLTDPIFPGGREQLAAAAATHAAAAKPAAARAVAEVAAAMDETSV